MAVDYDIVVVGAGMVGGSVAALLSRAGFSVAVIEASEPAPFDLDGDYGLRVSAISPGSCSILAEAGAWRIIEQQRTCPYTEMEICEQGGDDLLRFIAADHGLDQLGSIIENDLIQAALWQVLQTGFADLYCPARLTGLEQLDGEVRIALDDGRQLNTPLLVAADGAASVVRGFTTIEQEIWEYNQRGLVSVITTENGNPGIAWQRFLDTGPLAFLPLVDGRSSIVWTLPTGRAEELLASDDDQFLAALNEAADQRFGEVLSCGPRGAFPLTMRLSRRYVDQQVVLLGDAAHVVHPLAGQGVNLGLQDAAALVEVLLNAKARQQAYNGAKALRRFERWRRSDNALMAGGIHGIQQLYSLLPGPVKFIRRAGSRLVDNSWLIKSRFLQRATGQHTDAPRLARGELLRELVQG